MFCWPYITVYQYSETFCWQYITVYQYSKMFCWPYITVYQYSEMFCLPYITVYQYSEMFCWPYITVYQYIETNVMHFLFNLFRIKGLYMFWALPAHPQKVLKNGTWYIACVLCQLAAAGFGVEQSSTPILFLAHWLTSHGTPTFCRCFALSELL
jgi:hypothetical protein